MDGTSENKIVITDIKMPFWSLVVFTVKAAIASIPAIIILTIIGAVIMALFGGIIGIVGS